VAEGIVEEERQEAW